MRRMMILAAVATASLAGPGAALAHGDEHHGGRHRHHHHARSHVLAFHAQSTAGSPSSAPPSSASAGTIASFSGGMLTITLADGSTVSGKVIENTGIECPVVTTSTIAGAARFDGRDTGDENNDNGDDRGQDGSSGPGPGDVPHEQGDCPGRHDAGDDDEQRCSTAALVPGASVKDALLSVSGAGAVWVKVQL